jgi:DNA-binding CsgD family transcriptional regulator
MTNDGYSEDNSAAEKQSKYGALALLVVVLFASLDVIEDSLSGIGLEHLILESVIIVTSLGVAVMLWTGTNNHHKTQSRKLRDQLLASREDAARWRSEAESLLTGLGDAIEAQFDRWGLSEAEKDIGLLILKGFSHKEIADVRQRSERTVRQQAASMYQKSALENRAQFSAFFLEDLLRPLERGETLKVG